LRFRNQITEPPALPCALSLSGGLIFGSAGWSDGAAGDVRHGAIAANLTYVDDATWRGHSRVPASGAVKEGWSARTGARPAVVAQCEAIRDGALDGAEALTADLARPQSQHCGERVAEA
jgi:hypothetical protein